MWCCDANCWKYKMNNNSRLKRRSCFSTRNSQTQLLNGFVIIGNNSHRDRFSVLQKIQLVEVLNRMIPKEPVSLLWKQLMNPYLCFEYSEMVSEMDDQFCCMPCCIDIEPSWVSYSCFSIVYSISFSLHHICVFCIQNHLQIKGI